MLFGLIVLWSGALDPTELRAANTAIICDKSGALVVGVCDDAEDWDDVAGGTENSSDTPLDPWELVSGSDEVYLSEPQSGVGVDLVVMTTGCT